MFRLEMPFIDRASKRGSVLRWHKIVGDRVEFGDEILDIKIKVMHKETKPSVLTRITSRFRGKEVDIFHKLEYRRVIAVDAGELRTVETEAGTDVQIGSLLGILTSSKEEEVDRGRLDEALTFRVVTNLIEPA